jgi:hypothetical protein
VRAECTMLGLIGLYIACKWGMILRAAVEESSCKESCQSAICFAVEMASAGVVCWCWY